MEPSERAAILGHVAYDNRYAGVALDDAEGERIARSLVGRDILFMASHGVTVLGPSLAWAFDDLYYLERACMHQALATQLAGGGTLREIPEAVCRMTAAQAHGERQQSDLFLASIKRLLDRDQPGWRAA